MGQRIAHMLETAWAGAYHETTRDVDFGAHHTSWNFTWSTMVASIHDRMKSPAVNGTMGPERHAL